MNTILKFLAHSIFFVLISCSAPNRRSDAMNTEPPGSQLMKCGVVLPLGSYKEWDGGMIESPAVWYDSARSRYGMVYTGYGSTDSARRGYKYVSHPQIGLAWSDDLLHWKKDPRSPVFSGSGVAGSTDAYGASGPFIWFENGRT